MVFFCGLCYTEEWRGIFDFVVLNGDAGSLVANVKQTAEGITTSMGNFRGKGGSGAIDGFLFAISIVPAIMFSVAMIEVFDHYGATRAAGRLLNPILKPLMGIPGTTALALIASLQSTDAGAALTRSLADHKIINEKETKIFAAFQMAADAAIVNFLALGIALFVHDPHRQGACRQHHAPHPDPPEVICCGEADRKGLKAAVRPFGPFSFSFFETPKPSGPLREKRARCAFER